MSVNWSVRGRKSRAYGEHFEKMILASCGHYLAAQIAKIEKTPEPMKIIKPFGTGQFIACFASKAQPDFKGTLKNGRSVVFEAKHTDSDRMKYEALLEWQRKALCEHVGFGAAAFILCSFELERFYRVPLLVWLDMKRIFGRKYMLETELSKYKLRSFGLKIAFLEKLGGSDNASENVEKMDSAGD